MATLSNTSPLWTLRILVGLMSGLTLGLLSLDITSLMVLKNSGPPKERMYAARIIPLVKHKHLLLVTLLLCNAGVYVFLTIHRSFLLLHYVSRFYISILSLIPSSRLCLSFLLLHYVSRFYLSIQSLVSSSRLFLSFLRLHPDSYRTTPSFSIEESMSSITTSVTRVLIS